MASARGARETGRPTLVVGVGASAGGLQAMQELLNALPGRSGFALLLVQHLDAAEESALTELLASATGRHVVVAGEGAALEPDVVYVAPPGVALGLHEGRIVHSRATVERGVRRPIDDLFRSLARELGPGAAGVVLSGAGSDGTLGLGALRAAGGLTLAQEPATAAHPGMPQSAVDAGVVDLALPIAEMPAALARLARLSPEARARLAASDDPKARAPALDEAVLDEVATLLSAWGGVDLRDYKRGTVGRRILRRSTIGGYASVADYLAHLREEEAEQRALLRDLQVCVTEFFREPASFDALTAAVVAPLVAEAGPGAVLRVWCAGCATGEEAYSLAILFTEAMEGAGKPIDLQVFATDIAPAAITAARSGVYPEAAVASLSEERRARFFTRVPGGLQVRPPLRDVVSFAVHDLCRDPPFSRLDLVACRNVLIYLRPPTQERILRLLHFALLPGRYLFLGASESAGALSHAFATVSKDWRIYRKVGDASPPGFTVTRRLAARDAAKANAQGPGATRGPSLADRARDAALKAHAPPCVVVAGDGRVLFMHGELRPYLRFPQGEPRLDLRTMVDPELATRAGTALNQCRRTAEVATAVSSAAGTGASRTLITATPAPDLGEGAVVLAFEAVPEARPSDPRGEPAAPRDEALVEELERELEATRADLRHTVEELEASNEKLRTTSEESLSINEELQSANEELEAATEELRSLNEELTTVNVQLREKVTQVQKAHDDLTNFFASTRVATLFLDEELRVQRVTPVAQELLGLAEEDVGRAVAELVGAELLQEEIVAEARAVLQDLAPVTRELRTEDGRWFTRRILPYRTQTRRVEGVVVTLLDVTALQRALEDLAVRERQQAVIARLGLLALEEPDLETFLGQVAREVQETLGTDFCKILEVQPGGERLFLRAGVGWREGAVGAASVSAGLDSQAGYTLQSREPVVAADLERERRFRGSPLLLEHGVRSGLSCVIRTGERPFGVIGAHSRELLTFSAQDQHFLQAAATVLAAAINRLAARLRLALEREVTRVLTRATSLDEAALGIHAAFAAVLGTTVGELWWPDPQDPARLVCRALCVEPPLERGEVEAGLSARAFARGEGSPGRVWARGEAEWVTSFVEERRYVRRGSAEALGLVAGVALPIVVRGRPAGVFTALGPRRLIVDQDLLRSLETLGGAIGDFVRRAEAEAQARWLAAITESSHDAIISYDFDGVLLGWNSGAERLFGYRADEVVGGSLQRIVPDGLWGQVEEAIVRTRAGEVVEPFESRRVCKDGRIVDVSIRVSPVKDEAGRTVAVSAADRDVTRQKEAVAALADAERRLRATFENAAVGVAHVGLTGRWTWFNQRLLDITGYGREELLQRTFQDITHPDDLAPDLEHVEQLLAGERDRYTTEKRYVRRDGAVVWVNLRVSLVRDEAGAPSYFVAVVEDITERRRTQEELEESEWRFRQVLVHSPVALMVYDDLGRVVAVSRSWTTLTGYAADEVETLDDWTRRAHREGADEARAYFEQVWRGDVAPPVELELWTRAGERRVVLSSAASLGTLRDGRSLGICAAADVTAQKAAERELRRADQQKDEFLAVLGHELRNPLAAIQNAVALLGGFSGEDPRLERLRGVLERQTAHMGKLLEGLLDVSRIVRGKIELERAALDLVAVVRAALDDFGPPIEARGLEVRVDLPEGPLWVEGDRVRLTQVVGNLLSNAAKFTGPPGTVWVEVGRAAGQATLLVRDTGTGIDAELLPHVFETFRQAGQDLARASGGLGLGLSLVKVLVELHGGSVVAESEGPGRGAAFTVRLPLAERPPPPPSPAEAGRPTRVLVVEDNADTADLLRELLEARGHEAAVAYTGREALARARELRPDVVLCDLGLPDITGFEVARKLRDDGDLAHAVLVALTGYGRPEDLNRARAAGFDHHVTKPAGVAALERVIATAGRRGLEQQ